ncbi:MAG: ChaN family lipoprotein [Polaromonas sp.]|uniref:ChaN family lipoprotein n=1 Tax=Polaromonas sp. TaxID=1869339 RepID=UPI0024876025|nr:ChaN family lipoprotein [Polaromonas sp.]MDI1239932.1 ChaN family lipoprotein [Polaromonas sp.]MDI1340951.1 ChaN family lipoprotein [Polaromonas sp.]
MATNTPPPSPANTCRRNAVLAPLLLVLLAACARVPEPRLFPHAPNDITARTEALLPADVILLGEQHDAAEHQDIHRQVIEYLAVRGQLAAVALEMAEAGTSTAALKSNSTQLQVQASLGWNNKSWPWTAYGPAVMAAVKAGVPVLGANLPPAQMRGAMADGLLDQPLPGPALKAQQQLIRIGHCGVLPEDRISPMTRIQIARDIRMARTLQQAALPGKTVVLLAGSGHVNRSLGVPQHLPPGLAVKAVQLRAGPAAATPDARQEAESRAAFDAVWPTPVVPEQDYCASLRETPGAK